MKLITQRRGRKSGNVGVTIHILEQGSKNSKTLTVHGFSVEECYEKIRFFFRALEKSKAGITILIEE